MEERLKAIESKLDTILKLLNDGKHTSSPVTKSKKSKQKTVKAEKTGSAIVTIYNDLIIVTGNTYSNKDNLKSIGARWNKEYKGWQFNANSIEKVREKSAEVFESVSYKEINKNIQEPVISEEDNNSFHEQCCDINSDSD